jgi:hypothetical protein
VLIGGVLMAFKTRDHVLLVTLCAILLLNIIAILILNNRLADEEAARRLQEERAAKLLVPVAAETSILLPAVRTVLLPAPCDACDDLFDVAQYLDVLDDTINMSVERAAPKDVPQFGADILPAIAFNATLAAYATFTVGWEQAGPITTIPDGPYAGTWYVLPSHNAPYYDVPSSQVRGRVRVTYLAMARCEDCYDVSRLHEELLDSRITPWEEETVDVDSPQGKILVQQHAITRVPTMILDAEAAFYSSLQPGWSVVGSIEEDGSYVLRDLRRMSVVYYDLERDEVLRP